MGLWQLRLAFDGVCERRTDLRINNWKGGVSELSESGDSESGCLWSFASGGGSTGLKPTHTVHVITHKLRGEY